MKINTKYTNLDSTLAIQTYIADAISDLEKYLERMDKEGSVIAHVELGRTTNHHKKGDVYRAECNLEMGGKRLRAEFEGSDPRVCIDNIVDRLKADIKKMGAVSRPQDSSGQKKLRKLRGKN